MVAVSMPASSGSVTEDGKKVPPVKAAVPTSVFSNPALAGKDVVAVMVRFDPETIAKTLGGAATTDASGNKVTVSGVISFEIKADGESFKATELEDPIVLGLPVNYSASESCAYWDGDNLMWSDDGVSSTNSDGQMTCLVTHLSMFGSVAAEVGSVLNCANLEMLTPKGLAAMGKGNWWYFPGSVSMYVLFALHFWLFTLAVQEDMKNRSYKSDQHFVTSHENYKHEKHSMGYKIHHGICDPWHQFVAAVQHGCHTCRYGYAPITHFAGIIMVHILTLCIQTSCGAVRSITHTDIKKHVKNTKKIHKHVVHMQTKDLSDLTEIRRTESNLSATPSDFAARDQEIREWLNDHIDEFYKGGLSGMGFLKLLWMFYMALQPWSSIMHASIYVPATLRVLILSARVFGALMLSGLFFSTAGGAQTNDAPSECDAPKDLVRNLLRAAIIGIFSSIISTIPIAIMVMLRIRAITWVAEDDDHKRKKLIRTWKIEDGVLWLLGSVYNVLCMLFLLSFCANVTLPDHWEWLIAASFSLFKMAVIIPFTLALVLTIVATIGSQLPDIINKARIKLNLHTVYDLNAG